MNTDVEFHIRQNYPWNKLPANVKQVPCVTVSWHRGGGREGGMEGGGEVGVNLSMSHGRLSPLAPLPLQGFSPRARPEP